MDGVRSEDVSGGGDMKPNTGVQVIGKSDFNAAEQYLQNVSFQMRHKIVIL